MRALDTCVLARYVMQDDPVQTPIATMVLAEPCYLPDTVLLELAWLLSSRFALDRATLAATLHDLVLLPTVTVSNPDLIDWVVERFVRGGDFADMLHIAAAGAADRFATFDHGIKAAAGAETPIPVETLA